MLLVAAKIELIDGLEVREVTEVVNDVETAIRRSVPSARLIYLEPDIFRTALPDDVASSLEDSADPIVTPAE